MDETLASSEPAVTAPPRASPPPPVGSRLSDDVADVREASATEIARALTREVWREGARREISPRSLLSREASTHGLSEARRAQLGFECAREHARSVRGVLRVKGWGGARAGHRVEKMGVNQCGA